MLFCQPVVRDTNVEAIVRAYSAIVVNYSRPEVKATSNFDVIMDLVEEMHSNTHRHLPSYKHYTLVCDRGSLTLSSSNYIPMSCTKAVNV